MALDVVVDLGTSRFRAALVQGNKVLSEACTTARHSDGHVTIGESAERMVGRHPEHVELIHPVDGGNVIDYDAVVSLFRYILSKLVSQRIARRFDLTLSIPTMSTAVEKRAIKEAAAKAGASHVELFETVVAAAIGADIPLDEPSGCLLVSLGAGTTEAALLSFGGIVESRRLYKGGRSVDEEIMEWLRKEEAFLVGKHTAERLKRELSTHPSQTLHVTGRSLKSGLPDHLDISTESVQHAIHNYYESIVRLIVQTIESCPPELVGDIVDKGIVLVGGGANDANLVDYLTRRTKVPVVVAPSPETCVLRGMRKAKTGARGFDVKDKTANKQVLSAVKDIPDEARKFWKQRFSSRFDKSNRNK